MTLGVGRGINLNFDTLADLMEAAESAHTGFDVAGLAALTGFHPNKVKGQQSWARAMGLVRGTEITSLGQELQRRDPRLANPVTRGACYVELAGNPQAEVAFYMCQEYLPMIAARGEDFSIEGAVATLRNAGVGADSHAAQQPQRDISLFVASLRSSLAFDMLGLLHEIRPQCYGISALQAEPALVGYALLRYWPERTVHLRVAETHRLLAPLFLDGQRFLTDLATLERYGVVKRITSSGLDQIWPSEHCSPLEVLWTPM